MVTVSDEAAQRIRALLEREDTPERGLRIFVDPKSILYLNGVTLR